MEQIILYKTPTCPKCKVLKKKLEDKGIEFTENEDIDEMLSMGIMNAPTLSVNGELLDFMSALDWVKNY
ncbi:MAG: glutaredoxin domain-containing protein [Methanobrevibacter sp.]|nr:glutaredoxin domain-containing protein [Methanobrevibacter sp.]